MSDLGRSADDLFDGFIESFDWYMRARDALKKARDACEYDRGHFCFHEQEEADKAEQDFKAAFKRLVTAIAYEDTRERGLARIQGRDA